MNKAGNLKVLGVMWVSTSFEIESEAEIECYKAY